MTERNPIDIFYEPKSIAIIGAKNRASGFGARLPRFVLDIGVPSEWPSARASSLMDPPDWMKNVKRFFGPNAPPMTTPRRPPGRWRPSANTGKPRKAQWT